MKRILYFLFLICGCSHAQFFPAIYVGPPSETCPSTTVIGEFIRDNFTGTSLDSTKYTILNGGLQTISVSGGKIHFTGSLGATKNVSQMLKYTFYPSSMLRRYVVKLDSIQFTTIDANTKGMFVGVESNTNASTALSSSWANVDPSNVDSVELLQTDNLQVIGNTVQTATGIPAINTSDLYKLELTEDVDTIYVKFTNISASTSVTVKYAWNTLSAFPRRPTIFRYSFGGCGSTAFTAESFSVSTLESRGANLIIGNSIEVGHDASSFNLGFAALMSIHTSCKWQIMAGAGLGSGDGFYPNRTEIIAMNPTYVISGYGTNDNSGNQATYRLAVDALEATGIHVYVLSVVNGGDPFVSTTYNYSLRVTYFPSEFVDIWTTGQSQMSVGNGLMQDLLHPNTAGHAFLAPILKSKLPSLFPL